MGKTAIYLRVSTEGQELEQQKQACVKFCEIKGWPEYEIFTEVGSAGKFRPVFRNLITRLIRTGEFSQLVVFRIDRGWRNSREFIMDFDSLATRGVDVISVMEGLDQSTPIGKAMMTILVALAELERANISQATRDRLRALKNLGKSLGRPKGSKDSKKRRNIGYLIREARKRGDRKLVEKYQDS
jgi:putative DNA-invertase from lambdoid prophage Rac